MSSPFVHLHVHSEYSLLDGACRVHELAQRAAELEMPAVALTDHGVMYGAIDFYQACQKAGVRPLLGCEVYVAPRSRFDRDSQADRSSYHLTLLAESLQGYRNLLRLVSAAHLEGFYYRPRADLELLAECREGLLALSACLQGKVARHLQDGAPQTAEQAARELQELFGPGNFYLELMDQGLPGQAEVNAGLVELGERLGIPLVATNDVHYLRQEDAEAHDVLLCIQTQACLNDPGRLRFESDEFYLKSAEEMQRRFAATPQALTNTLEIAERCAVELELGKLMLPRFEVPPGHDLTSYLRKLCEDNLEWRYGRPVPAEVRQRVDYELEVIERTSYSGYFLIVGDFVQEAKRRGILVGPGRGSATGSIVAYLLGIVDVDPLKHGLIFERMLNPERVSPPDIDMDFPDDRREEILEYVKEKYGRDRVAQVGTFNTLGARAAIRDVGRVLGVPLEQVDQVAKLVPPGTSVAEAVEQVAELKSLAESQPPVQRVLDFARRLEGLARHVSVHAAAVVVADADLTNYVPLRGEKGGLVATQYAMDPVVEAGLVKMDFLGLKTLTVVANTIEAVKRNHGVEVDLHHLPLDDAKTYELLSRGDTVAVFQLESEGMRQLLRRLQPDRFEHVIALVALYRPGPMQHAEEFCAGRHGAAVRYLHPRLEPILAETYGVILYQEQVMQIARDMAGFTMPQAEVIMRAMAKKQEAKMQEMKPLFLEGCQKEGMSAEQAQHLFTRMETFSNYGFNKSHSAAYGLVAYWTAYLKANYPAEFMAAHLSTVMDHSEEVAKAIAEARRMGLRVRPPSVNQSRAEFSVSQGEVLYGLAAIKNFGHHSAEAIVAEREGGGPFRGLHDFCRRLPVEKMPRAASKLLVEVGALDEFGERGALLAAVEAATQAGQQYQQDQAVGRFSLFGPEPESAEAAAPGEPPLPRVPPLPEEEKLAMERRALGIYVSAHPLEKSAEQVQRATTAQIEELDGFPHKSPVIVAGIVEEARQRTTRAGDPMLKVTLQGLAEQVEVTVFPSAYDECSRVLQPGELVAISGRVERRGNGDTEDGPARLLGEKAWPLPEAPRVSRSRREQAQQTRQRYLEEQSKPPPPPPDTVVIEVDALGAGEGELVQLRDLISRFPGDRPVVLRFLGQGSSRRVRLGPQFRVDNEGDFPVLVRQIAGVLAVYEEPSPRPARPRAAAPAPVSEEWGSDE